MLARSSYSVEALGRAAVHPGEILADELAAMNVSVTTFCAAVDLSILDIAALMRGAQSVTSDMALKLARYFGNSARFWINLQAAYDMAATKPADPETL